MSTLSFPSKAAIIFDVPEPGAVTGKFIYRRFEINERTSTQQSSNSTWNGENAREIQLNFKPLTDAATPGTPINSIKLSDKQKRNILLDNLSSIVSEVEAMGESYVGVFLQDPDTVQKLQSALEADSRLSSAADAGVTNIEQVLSYANQTDKRSKISSAQLNTYGASEYTFIDPATGEPIEVPTGGDEVSFFSMFSRKFVGTVINKAQSAPASPLFSSAGMIAAQASEIELSSKATDDSSILRSCDYEPQIKASAHRAVNTGDIVVAGNALLGYVIRKTIVNRGGETSAGQIVVTNPNRTQYVDNEILYGQIYRYSIRAVYLVRFHTFSGKQVLASDILVASRQSPNMEIVTEETVPPRPPVNLQFWLDEDSRLNVSWDYPFNPQNDISRFNLWKRDDLNNPFSLVKQYRIRGRKTFSRDAGNPEIQINPNLISTDYESSTICIDGSWDKEDHIYAVSSQDVHGLSSGYSEQFLVKFNEAANRVEASLVVYSNSPLPYPNFNLKSTLTVDSFKVKKYRELDIYLHTDILDIVSAQGEIIPNVLRDDDEPTYKIQLINLDWQQGSNIPIYVKTK